MEERRRPEGRADRPEAGAPLPWRQVHQVEPPLLYLHQSVVDQMAARAREGARRRHEDLGLLIGDWARDAEDRAFTVAWGMPTGRLETSPVSVRFAREGLEQVARDLDRRQREYLVVGWYHTHLDLGCFMSPRDLRTQRGGFPHQHQVAVVVDPTRGEAAAFGNGPRGPGTLPAALASFESWGGA